MLFVKYVMAQIVSLFSVDLPHLYIWSKFEDSIPFEYLLNELRTKGEYFAHTYWQTHAHSECTPMCMHRMALHKNKYFASKGHAKKMCIILIKV